MQDRKVYISNVLDGPRPRLRRQCVGGCRAARRTSKKLPQALVGASCAVARSQFMMHWWGRRREKQRRHPAANTGLASGTPRPAKAEGMCTGRKVKMKPMATLVTRATRRISKRLLRGQLAGRQLSAPQMQARGRARRGTPSSGVALTGRRTTSPSKLEKGVPSSDQQTHDAADQARGRVPEPGRGTQAGSDASAGKTAMEASSVPPGFEKMAMPTTGTDGPSGLHRIRCTIRRSSK